MLHVEFVVEVDAGCEARVDSGRVGGGVLKISPLDSRSFTPDRDNALSS
jgi:hypothetical protein